MLTIVTSKEPGWHTNRHEEAGAIIAAEMDIFLDAATAPYDTGALAFYGNAVVGVCYLDEANKLNSQYKSTLLSFIAVARQHQRRKIGSMLLSTADTLAADSNYDAIRLYAMTAQSEQFYARHGYRQANGWFRKPIARP